MSDAPSRKFLPSRIARNPWLLLVMSSFVWGGNVVAARVAAGEISPMILVGIRWAIVTVVLLTFARREAISALVALRPHWPYVLAMGITGFTASNALLYEGARFTSGINVAIIQGILPVLVLIGARVVYGLRAGWIRIGGVALTLAGILLIATEGDPARIADLAFNKGDLITMLGSVLYAGFTLALRKRPALPAFAFFVGLALAAFVSSLPAMAVEAALGASILPGWRGILVLFYVAIFTSIVGQVFWIRGVEMIGPSRAGVFQNLVPVIGALLSVVLLRETFHWFHSASLGLVITGLFISELGKR